MENTHTTLSDTFGRRFQYLRLSLTEACNFRCTYCLPDGYQGSKGPGFLNLEEIRNVGRAFAALGIRKLRLTGGEPTLRRDFLEIASCLSELPEIQTLAISSNGFQLHKQTRAYRAAGVSQLNISIDSLNPDRFALRTGRNLLPQIRRGIEDSLELGYQAIKINAVLHRDSLDEDWTDFQEWIRTRPLTIRFIELMPTGGNHQAFQQQHIKSGELRTRLLRDGWQPLPRSLNGGPAEEFRHPEFAGRMGLIAPYDSGFCSSCNRLRMTSRGELRLCLFSEGATSVRHLLQDETQQSELRQHLARLVLGKNKGHQLAEGLFGNNQSFSAMGG